MAEQDVDAITAALFDEFRTAKLTDAAYGYQFALLLDIWQDLDGPAYRRARELGQAAAKEAAIGFIRPFAEAAGQLAEEYPYLTIRDRPELPAVVPPRRGQLIQAGLGPVRTWHRASGDLRTRRTPMVVIVETATLCGYTVTVGRSDSSHRPPRTADEPTGKVCRTCQRVAA